MITAPEIAFIAIIWLIVIVVGWLLAGFMYTIYSGRKSRLDRIFSPVERVFFRISGVDPTKDMTWKQYFISLLLLNSVQAAFAFLILSYQSFLPLNPQHFPDMSWSLALNTALSFSANCDLQHYAGENSLSYFSQMMAITFLQFTSAASGMSVAVAIFRGFSGKFQGLGNFYSDFIKSIVRVLLPISFIASIVLVSTGIPQTLNGYVLANTISGGTEILKVGPVASMTSIMQLGTNGGGYFGANSAYPFENPNPISNWIEVVLMMVIPTAFPFLFGRMVGNKKEGNVLLFTSYMLYAIDLAVAFIALSSLNRGMEARLGVFSSVFWTVTTTAFTTGSVNASLAGMNPLVVLSAFMGMLIQATPGGAGVGTMYMLMYVVMTVFIVGLMAGRTPEYLGSKITPSDVKLAMVAFISHPIIILLPTIIVFASGVASSAGIGRGPIGFSEVFYEYTSAAANNGSDFLGTAGNTVFFNVSTGIVIWLGRFIPILVMLNIAGNMNSRIRNFEEGLKTDNILFAAILLFSITILVILTFFPFLVIGPLLAYLEGIQNAL
ncbi:MAG: potassium-transporting ATPase subunit KdpA [Candidatus Thermoplasmatota archaeon]|nr:potassium-transporting ATPase subunit KdpA [Candidatus Thermoplasmatota archaeon]MCL5438331.1 potassium-transporting ATPase subunit KdpA [Candidatus Thermoplasmatota archaeon]